jgi:hypothetical protein
MKTLESVRQYIAERLFDQERMLVTVKVDGKVSRVPVSTLVRSYQKNQAADNRLRAATLALRAAKSAE